MVSAERISEMAESIGTILHDRTGNLYFVTTKMKAKVGKEWCDGVCYVSVNDAEAYWRSLHDFEGFTEVDDER